MTKTGILRVSINFVHMDIKREDVMQIFALLSASSAMIGLGALISWPSPSIPLLISEEYGITIEEASYLTVIAPLSMALWSPIYCKLIDVIGRKFTLLSCSVLHILAWLLIAFAGDRYVLYAVSRFISGMTDACCFATVPTYISEVTKPRIRDIYGNMVMVLVFFGQFLANVVGYYFDIQMTALIFICLPVLFFVTFVFMPESPYYCCMIGRLDRARLSLQKLYRKENVEKELIQLSHDVTRQMSERASFKELFVNKSNRKALVIANITRSFQQLGGLTALSSYSQYIFLQVGSSISSGVSAMIFAGLLLFTTFIGNIVADKLGKTRAMVFSSIGSGFALLSVTLYFYVEAYTDLEVVAFNFIPLTGLVFYVIFYTVGLAIVPTALVGELFSASIRSRAAMITNIIFALYMAGTNKLFQYLMTTFGIFVPFAFFTICLFIGAVVAHYIVPNTQGKTLEEIQQILKGNVK